jgi:hypothetical protein
MDYSRLSMPLGEAIFTQRSIRRFRPDPVRWRSTTVQPIR